MIASPYLSSRAPSPTSARDRRRGAPRAHRLALGVALGIPLSAAAVALAVAPAAAGPAEDAAALKARTVCVPQASGVPTMEGPPHWGSWAGGPADKRLDDPRWLGAVAQSFSHGSAKAPLHARAVWSPGPPVAPPAIQVDYLYLSFLVDIEGLVNATTTSPRDLFVGFRLPGPPPAAGAPRGYIFQFHFDGVPADTVDDPTPADDDEVRYGLMAPTYCGRYGDCDEASATPRNFWRVFVDQGNPGTCGVTGAAGAKYDPLPGVDDATPPIPWMTEAVRYWKLSSIAPVFLKNRWAVQVRIPVGPAGTPITTGISRDSTFWYEATSQVTGTGGGGGDYLSLARWPRDVTTAICPGSGLQDSLVHQELADPAKAGPLVLYAGARPDTCYQGVSLSPQGLGSLFETALTTSAALAAAPLDNQFTALKPDGTPGVNTVVAQVENHGPTAVSAPLLARFRLAGWGAAPWSVAGDHGRWKEMRAAKNGVCGDGTSPSCTSTSIAAGGKTAIHFRWQLGDDPVPGGMGASEYCQFGLDPPPGEGSCVACTCTSADQCDVPSGPGTRSDKPGSPCVSSYYQHDQCMLVELSAPNGDVAFERQSAWNNMAFGQMSIFEREALIDGRGLPVASGQLEQDLVLVVMPRNMPEALPGGPSTGNQLLAQGAFDAARRIVDGYRDSYARLSPEQRLALAHRLQHPIPTPEELKRDPRTRRFGEAFVMVEQVRTVLPPEDYERAGKLLALAGRASDEKLPAEQLTRELYAVAGSSLAADIVPTLEIYAYYRPGGPAGPGQDGRAAYLPMTSFSVFLSHQGAMNGIDWELDGATRVGLNVFRVRIPVERARRIRVRSQAIEPGELVQKPGDPGWPGGGCCGARQGGVLAGVNHLSPTLLVGACCFGRRRRRKGARSSTRVTT
jgi:hypothetical protein